MLKFGLSPCPNDTLIFYALMNTRIDPEGLEMGFRLEDVETLNCLAMEGGLDLTKISCAAYVQLQEHYQFLDAGAALGRGCGPLVVTSGGKGIEDLQGGSVAVPGRLTTAFLLWRIFSASSGITPGRYLFMPFHEIMEAVRKGEADAGLIIHEGRFTYQGYGLSQVVDLGEWWEKETGLPLPLGGIIAKRSLGEETIRKSERLIRQSLLYAREHREEAMPFIRSHAQELSDEVIMKHIALYVNECSIALGEEGRAALSELLSRSSSIETINY
ncbi:MAG: 1,4-dihydroxy-6-naphthoate synthase [Nitrospirales bacterium]|nr:1,4-dihydroxy-6-naphthoate synthase [Nitrospirales bacterium]